MARAAFFCFMMLGGANEELPVKSHFLPKLF
jgi:hypothetical protein